MIHPEFYQLRQEAASDYGSGSRTSQALRGSRAVVAEGPETALASFSFTSFVVHGMFSWRP
jgi:hypothetical protein